jgi:uncharacterized protein (TIGR00661 family)
MATIFYSIMGEGRGHAARARAMIEHLRGRHRIVVYTYYEALAFLRELYPDCPDVEIREIEGLRFHYTGRRLNLSKTIAKGLHFRMRLGEIIGRIARHIDRDRPDLVITDFEPVVPRAANRRGVPVLSLDHQHFILAYDLSALPRRLQLYAWLMRPAVRAFGIRAQRTVVSAFYKPPLRRGFEHCVQVGPLLRPHVRQVQPSRGDYVLCYLRKTTPPRVIDILAALDRPLRIYGFGAQTTIGKIEFRPIDEQTFVDDLAGCEAVVAAAGNQLLGEALHFRKPFFAIPESKHHEQCINAYYLKSLGGGDWTTIERLTPPHLAAFVGQLEAYRVNLERTGVSFDGTSEALAQIAAFLPNAARNSVNREKNT